MSKNYQQVYLFSKTSALQQQGYGEIILKDGTHFYYTDYMYEVSVETALAHEEKYFNDVIFLETTTDDIAVHNSSIRLSAEKRIEWSNDIFKNDEEYLFYSPTEDELSGSIIVKTKDNQSYEYTTSFNKKEDVRHSIYNDSIDVGFIKRSDIVSQEVKNLTLLDRVKTMLKFKK